MNLLNHTKTSQGRAFFAAATLSLFALFGLQACGGGGGGDGTPTTPTLSVAAASVNEGTIGETPTVDFFLTLSVAASSDVTVTYSTSDGSATTADLDYVVSTAETLVIPAGQTTGTINITVTGDDTIEADEDFNLEISNAQNATITGGSQMVTGTIQSDDTLAGYYTGDSSIIETVGDAAVDRTSNIQVIADIDQLSIIDLTNNFIYIVTIDDFTSATTFTASARVYFEGDFINTTTITADFTAGTSIDLTLSGTGNYTAGMVTLNYSDKNGDAPLVFAENGTEFWQDTPYTVNLGFPSNNITNITTGADVPSTNIKDCAADSINLQNVVSKPVGRIRSFNAVSDGNCDPSITLTGYITSFDTDPTTPPDEDRVLFIWFNDSSVHAASLEKFN